MHPGRYAYRVGGPPGNTNIGHWTAAYPNPRVWFDESDIQALKRIGALVPVHGNDDALKPAGRYVR